MQDSLKKLSDIKTFTIDDKSIYDELTGEISEEYGVIFKFNSMTREKSPYMIYIILVRIVVIVVILTTNVLNVVVQNSTVKMEKILLYLYHLII